MRGDHPLFCTAGASSSCGGSSTSCWSPPPPVRFYERGSWGPKSVTGRVAPCLERPPLSGPGAAQVARRLIWPVAAGGQQRLGSTALPPAQPPDHPRGATPAQRNGRLGLVDDHCQAAWRGRALSARSAYVTQLGHSARGLPPRCRPSQRHRRRRRCRRRRCEQAGELERCDRVRHPDLGQR